MNGALRWLCIFLFSINISAQVTAQVIRSHRLDRELMLSYDNDLIFKTDRYYTSGANISYSRIVHRGSKLHKFLSSKRSDSLKVITQYNYGHKIFTPNGIKQRKVESFDRPYAGWHYLKFELKNFPAVNNMNKFKFETGMIGGISGIGNFQKWWHSSVGIVRPKGWQYQINNEAVVNIGYNKVRSWKLLKFVDLITDSGIKLGNGENKFSQDIAMRLGKFNNLINSGYEGSRISSIIPQIGNKDTEEEEGFLFYGVTAEHVMSNIFIQGSFLHENSLHTEEIETFVITRRWGFMYTNYYTTFYFTIYRLSAEVIGGTVHRFINLNLGFRF